MPEYCKDCPGTPPDGEPRCIYYLNDYMCADVAYMPGHKPCNSTTNKCATNYTCEGSTGHYPGMCLPQSSSGFASAQK